MRARRVPGARSGWPRGPGGKPPLSGSQAAVEEEQFAAVQAKLANLEAALGNRVAEALKAGVSGAAVAKATKVLEAELAALRKHLAHLEQWAGVNRAEGQRRKELWELAAVAARRLDT